MSFLRNIIIISGLLFTPYLGLYSQTSSSDFTPLSGIENGMEAPMRLAVDQWDNIYVTDVYQKCIKKYDMNGVLVATLAQGASPVSIAVNPEGVLFYGDGASGFIYRMGSNGQPVVFYTGTVYPSSLAFSPDNILYVADNVLKAVLAIDLSGDLVGTIGDNLLVFPTGLAFDVKNNRILVAEHGGLGASVSGSGIFGKGPMVKVYMFDRQGNELGSFGTFGSSNGKFYRVQGISIGRCGNIYLCESFQGNISVFTENGSFISKFGEYGSGPGELNLPVDIAFDSQERIIISCYNKGSLELFTINDPLPSASIVTHDIAVCNGEPASITIELSGTSPWSLTYTRNGIDPTTINNITSSPFVLTVNMEGVYQISALTDATAGGTCFSGAAHVSYHPQPTSTISCGNQTICQETTAIIPVNFSGDSPWTFTYTRDGNNPVTISTTHNPYLLEADQPGLYAVTALTGRNCQGNIFNGSSLITTRPLPTATFTEGNNRVFICEGDPPLYLDITFTGSSPWTFLYTVDDENPTLVQTSENPFHLPATLPGTYEVKSVSDDYCSSTNTYGYPEVIINPKPSAILIANTIGLCPNSINYFPIEFTGTPPFTFTITRNGNNPFTTTTSDNPYMYPVTKLGVYKITGMSDNNCNGDAVTDSVIVRRAHAPKVKLPKKDVPICEGLTAEIPILFKGNPPWTFTYTHNGNNPVTLSTTDSIYNLIVNSSGDYELISVNDINCDAKKLPKPVEVVDYLMPISDFSYSIDQLIVSFDNESTCAGDYLWLFGDGSSSTDMSPVHDYNAPGFYTVELTAFSEYCGSHSSSQMIMLGNQIKSSQDIDQGTDSEANMDIAMQLYPNPSNGLFTLRIEGGCSADVYVEVISMTGQTLLSLKPELSDELNSSGIFTKQLDISSFAQGVYQVQLRCGDTVIRRLMAVTGE